MLSVWRLVDEKYASTAFSGDGARLYGGRWNSKGIPAVYTAATKSLATLEMAVQAGSLLPRYAVIEAVIPDDVVIETIDHLTLPDDWRSYGDNQALRQIGDDWLIQRRTAVLRVSSAVIVDEYNYILNPMHPDFAKIKIKEPHPFNTDQRLL